MRLWLPLILLCCGLVSGCTDFSSGTDLGLSDARFTESGTVCADPNADEDGDGIPNSEEGCTTGRDTDQDKIPDWQDFDSDSDGIQDSVEKGSPSCPGAKKPGWPCDTDGDGTPDYLDVDSDNDGLLDKEEDVSGDGLLGCCLTTCGQPDLKWQKDHCILTTDGCGHGQKCENGKCTPTIDFHCSNGETDTKKKDSFGDGKLDNERGTYICRDATEDKPKGRKSVQLRKSTLGDWHVALEKTAKYNELTIDGAGPKEVAGVIDEDGQNAEVAGFVLSRDTTKEKVQEELTSILAAINSRVPGGQGTVTVRASGSEVKSHDKFDSVQGTILDLSLSGASSNIATVRNELLATLLGKQMPQMGNLPTPYGSSASDFVIRFVTVRRFEFKRDENKKLVLDAKGNPVDSGDQSKWRLLVMGSVAARANYQDPTRLTGFLVDDLSGGTALAVANDAVDNECDVGTISSLPVADIIWVVDESGSMSDNRQDIVNNANNFFARALSSGLDFRMGVTGVCNPKSTYGVCGKVVGKFCSKKTTQSDDDGGDDRFLGPTEQDIFSSCVNNPPGNEGGSEYGLTNTFEAVKKHLPRQAGAPDKIRPEAKLVIIVATDEIPQELSGVIGYADYDKCQLDSSQQAAVNAAIKPQLDLLSGISDPEAAAMYHLIGGTCSNSCTADVGHGYRELAQALGGQVGDICQKDLGNSLQVIIDSIVGASSPVKLDYVPISSSLAVAMDGVEVKRSRTNGFDYRSSSNTIVFLNVKYKMGSEVVASYKRWARQTDIDKF